MLFSAQLYYAWAEFSLYLYVFASFLCVCVCVSGKLRSVNSLDTASLIEWEVTGQICSILRWYLLLNHRKMSKSLDSFCSLFMRKFVLAFPVVNKIIFFFFFRISFCRSSLLVIGIVCIVHANFVGWLVAMNVKRMIMIIWLHLSYLHASSARKNVQF